MSFDTPSTGVEFRGATRPATVPGTGAIEDEGRIDAEVAAGQSAGLTVENGVRVAGGSEGETVAAEHPDPSVDIPYRSERRVIGSSVSNLSVPSGIVGLGTV